MTPELDLAGKRVLLFAPVFFGYEKDIEKALQDRGAHVDALPDRPFTSPFMKAVTRFRRSWVLPASDRFFRKAVEDFGAAHYDIVLVVQGEGLSGTMLAELRSAFPRARFIWYLWDSLRNKPALRPNLEFFDRNLTFDRLDSDTYGSSFRPLFFGPGFDVPSPTSYDYDISFIGTIHSDRYRIVTLVLSALPADAKHFCHLYLQAPWVFYSQKLVNPAFRGARYEEMRFDPLPKSKVHEVFTKSRAVLDVEHPRQQGLTMRTFEALGAHKKLLTTNRSVQDADFYRPENILVVERDRAPDLRSGFLDSPFVPLPPEIYRKYSLQGWLQDVLNDDACVSHV